MEYTKNYHLPQWAEEDRIQMEDFNAAMMSIESGIGQALTTAEEGQAALAESIGASLESINQNLGSAGKNCRITWGSYTGNGAVGSSNPNRLNFDFTPRLVWVATGKHSVSNNSPSFYSTVLCNPIGGGSTQAWLNVEWGAKSVAWYAFQSGSSASEQFNASGTTYHWVAIGADE